MIIRKWDIRISLSIIATSERPLSGISLIEFTGGDYLIF